MNAVLPSKWEGLGEGRSDGKEQIAFVRWLSARAGSFLRFDS